MCATMAQLIGSLNPREPEETSLGICGQLVGNLSYETWVIGFFILERSTLTDKGLSYIFNNS